MSVTRRIYVSLPADPWLPPNLNALKWGIVDEIAKLGFAPEIFTNPRGQPGLASAKAWNPRDADEIARRCVGAAMLGMPRWRFRDGDGQDVLLPTEFNHYEGALARTLGLPTLVLVQRDMLRRVVFDGSFGGYVGQFPADADVAWPPRARLTSRCRATTSYSRRATSAASRASATCSSSARPVRRCRPTSAATFTRR